jgi:hypothetical protein
MLFSAFSNSLDKAGAEHLATAAIINIHTTQVKRKTRLDNATCLKKRHDFDSFCICQHVYKD